MLIDFFENGSLDFIWMYFEKLAFLPASKVAMKEWNSIPLCLFKLHGIDFQHGVSLSMFHQDEASLPYISDSLG